MGITCKQHVIFAYSQQCHASSSALLLTQLLADVAEKQVAVATGREHVATEGTSARLEPDTSDSEILRGI